MISREEYLAHKKHETYIWLCHDLRKAFKKIRFEFAKAMATEIERFSLVNKIYLSLIERLKRG